MTETTTMAARNSIVYRFRPHGSNPDMCIHWVDAPELGMLAKVFNQDVYNLPRVQRGLKTMKHPQVIFADYGETKPRHFHKLLNEWITRP